MTVGIYERLSQEPLKFDQQAEQYRDSNSWDICDVNNGHQDKCPDDSKKLF